MTYRQLLCRGLFALIAFALPTGLAWAQDEPQQQQDNPPIDQSEPKPAAHAPFPVIDPNVEDQSQNQDMRADFTPVTGVQTATLGTPGLAHSYWVPGFQYGSFVQSGLPNGTENTGWFAENFFLGNVSLSKSWSRSHLALNYSGGGFISTDSQQQPSGAYQKLGLVQTFEANRWLFQILDQFSYLPQSEFGFGVGTNLGIAGIGGSLGASMPGLSNSSTINQSLFATYGPVYSNIAVLQATYQLSPRGSVTIAGSYAILHFVDPGNYDTNSVLGSVGYNYSLTRNDSIGVFYRFTSFHYQDVDQAYGDNYVGFAYTRRITGRLALQLFAGPDITHYREAIGSDTQQVDFNLSAYLTYAMHNGSISAHYIHSLSGGSGVLTGSNLDQVSLSGTRRLTRVWSGNANFGFSHNSGLAGTSQAGGSYSYNSWYAGAGVNRPLGRNVDLGVAYSAYINGTGNGGNGSYMTNALSLSLQWHTRPFVIE